MKKDRTKLILIILVIVLALLVLYAFVIRPSINGYTVKVRNDGILYALSTVAQAAANCQTVPLSYGNQTINLVATECLQQQDNTINLVG